MRRPSFSLSSLALLSVAALTVPACFAGSVVATSSCPVELSAEQHPSSVLVPTQAPPPMGLVAPENFSARQIEMRQSLDFSIKNSRLQRIVAAELEVHGTSNKSRVLPAHEAILSSEPTADAVRKLHLASSIPADQQRTDTLAVKDLTSVAWISVVELQYADGSVWHTGPGRVCRVEPNPLMPVGD